MKWEYIEELNNLYLVSDTGIIKKSKTRKILKTKLNEKGYEIVVIMIKGKKHILRVHRLVAKAFIPNPNNLPQVNHIDGNKLNNCVNNLEWVTNEENYAHAIKNNLIRKDIKPIALYIDGEEIKSYSNIRDASKKTLTPYNTIYYSLKHSKHKHKKTKNIYWKYI